MANPFLVNKGKIPCIRLRFKNFSPDSGTEGYRKTIILGKRASTWDPLHRESGGLRRKGVETKGQGAGQESRSSNALASFKSAVSKPSVNQL